MTWHCPCGRRNRDNNDICTKCGGPMDIPSWAKPKVTPKVRTGVLGTLAAFAFGALVLGPTMAVNGVPFVDHTTKSSVTVDESPPATSSPTPSESGTYEPSPSATTDCEGDCKPWNEYGYEGSPAVKAAGGDEVTTPTDDSSEPADTPAGDEGTNPNLEITTGDDGKPHAVNTAPPTRGGDNAGDSPHESAPPAPQDQWDATTKDQNAEEPSDDATAG